MAYTWRFEDFSKINHSSMGSLVQVGRKFYGLCLAGLGIQQFRYADFLPVILPAWPTWIPGLALWAYLTAGALLAAGALIIFEKKTKATARITGGAFLILFLFCHIPHLIIANPYSNYLGTWTQAFKILALSGGAFAVAGSVTPDQVFAMKKSVLHKLADSLVPFGDFFFSVPLIVFGIDHILYVENVATLVPVWIPGRIFWTYFTAMALIGSGVAIMLQINLRLVSILLGIMIFFWFALLHIPRAIADPAGNMGNEITSTFQALGFSGIALVLAYKQKSR